MWTVFCGSGGGRANAKGPHSCGRSLQKSGGGRAHAADPNSCGRRLRKRRWTRECARVQIPVDGFLQRQRQRWTRKCGGPNSCGRGLQKRRRTRKCSGSEFMWMVFAEAAWPRKCGGCKFLWTAFCRSSGGGANAAGPISCGWRLQKRRWARRCRSPNSCGRCFAEAAVGAQMRGVHIHVDGVCKSVVEAHTRRVQIHVDGVGGSGGGRANARASKFLWTVFCRGRGSGGRANAAVQILVDEVCRSGGGRAYAAGSKSCGWCLRKRRGCANVAGANSSGRRFAEAAVDAQMRRAPLFL